MARRQRSLKRTTLIAIGCIVFLCSVGSVRLGLLWQIKTVWPVVGILLAIVSLKLSIRVVVVIVISSLLGIWRGDVYMSELATYSSFYGKKVTVVATAKEDAVYNKSSQLAFSASSIEVDNHKLKGKVQISGFGVNAIYEGDRIIAEGKLRSGYGSSQATMSFSKITVVERNLSFIGTIRRNFASGIASALPEPLASFAMGILIGQRATLPEGVKNDLRAVGLTHIIAVSGYNLTIMLRASQRLLSRHSKRISLILGLALVTLFLLMTGASASIVRASIVSILSLLAGFSGRQFKPLNLILLAAAITVCASPFYLWSDLGWHLSFLAFGGVMILAPLLTARFIKNKNPSFLTLIAIETICAELMTLPLILHYFGQMTLAGLPSNVLVVTLVPFAMLLSMFAGLAGMFFASFSGWFAWPAIQILNFMLDTAHLIASLPNVFLQNIQFTLWQMIISYGIIVSIILLLYCKTKNPITDKITDKNTNLLKEFT